MTRGWAGGPGGGLATRLPAAGSMPGRVGRAVVDHPEPPPGGRVPLTGHDLGDQAPKRLDPSRGLAAAKQAGLVDVPGGQVGQRPTPLVLVLHPHRARLAWWEVGWQRQRAWMEGFSSALMTYSPASSGQPVNTRWYRSSTTPALAAKPGSRGKIQAWCCHGLSGSSASQRHSVVVDTSLTSPLARSSARSSPRLQRLKGTPRVQGSSQATALA
jgi:hypothetical protein